MRAGDDAQWAVGEFAGIEVQPNGDELAKYLVRRLDEQRTVFFGPAAQSWVFNALTHGDTQVLVHRDQPVLACRLLEEGALHSDRGWWQQRRDPGMRADSSDQVCAPALFKQVAGANSFDRQVVEKRCEIIGQKKRIDDHESAFFEACQRHIWLRSIGLVYADSIVSHLRDVSRQQLTSKGRQDLQMELPPSNAVAKHGENSYRTYSKVVWVPACAGTTVLGLL